MLRAADKVYRFLGVNGLDNSSNNPSLHSTDTPLLRHLIGDRLGYYIREGKHSMTAGDWEVFMNFADHQWKRKE